MNIVSGIQGHVKQFEFETGLVVSCLFYIAIQSKNTFQSASHNFQHVLTVSNSLQKNIHTKTILPLVSDLRVLPQSFAYSYIQIKHATSFWSNVFKEPG